MQIKSICDGIIRKLCFMFKSIWSNRDVSSGCRLLIKTFRFVYIVFAIYYVGDSMYSTFKKYKEGRIVVSITEEDYQQRVYPSITFCSKFTNGQNSALTPYFDILFEKAKQSGTSNIIMNFYAIDIYIIIQMQKYFNDMHKYSPSFY